MITFGSLPQHVYAVVGCLVFFLFLGMVFLFALGFSKYRKKNHVKNFSLLFGMIVTYIMLQCILGANDNMLSNLSVIWLIRRFSEIPVLYVCILCILLTVWEVVLIYKNEKWNRTHITDISLKEAIDKLPAGVCAYEENGRVVLKNVSMDTLCIAMSGAPLLNGLDFEKCRNEYSSTDMFGDKRVVILPDRSVRIFSEERLEIEGCRLILLTAFDMTEEYEKTQILIQKRKSVQELNARLIAYNRDIVSIITSQEILNAKIKIHDELGAGLLAIRHYLINGGGCDERKEIIEKLNHNMEFLQREMDENRQDEYMLMLSTAQALNVKVEIDGELPKEEPNKHIVATAIHECFTNTVRHAKGDLLHIQVINDCTNNSENGRIKVIFTNNGNRPTEKIVEKGGLASLRSMVEQVFGTMNIEDENRFELSICLPKRGVENGI